ncbi:unnamed protein product [Ambrosiozyma monospora]|uniref:Unnamed protein product n=1 Tax=Ambrosiozyma monospora TaxID=43982 RepID=A0ACB5SXQ3_AMBMO|nr:unnamed protein product [Ambrosiozyma monospora]
MDNNQYDQFQRRQSFENWEEVRTSLDQDQEQPLLYQIAETQSMASNSTLATAIRAITLTPNDGIPTFTQDMLGEFKRQLNRKAKTATIKKLQQFQDSLDYIRYKRFSTATPEPII